MFSLLLVALLLVLAAYVALRPRDMISLRSDVTGKQYLVKRSVDAQQMADRLATLEVRMRRLLDDASALMPDDPRLATIRRRWDGTLSEVEASGDVAFSIDKRSIHVCLRNREGAIEDLNTSMFVLIHELAHVATSDFGHSEAFWANMRFLLELAERLGIYTYENYDATTTTFCGTPLGASPLTCVKRGTCTSLLR